MGRRNRHEEEIDSALCEAIFHLCGRKYEQSFTVWSVGGNCGFGFECQGTSDLGRLPNLLGVLN